MRLFLDDIRTPPDETWTWVKTVEDAIPLLEAGHVEESSLDNDLGEGIEEGRALVLWMAEHDIWPAEEINVHSANPVAVEYMLGVIDRYGPFTQSAGTSRSRPKTGSSPPIAATPSHERV
jgi:hypothetical protein